MAMFARVTRFEDEPTSLDAAIDQFRHELAPAAKKVPGFLRAYLLVDRESGRGWH
jgi:quinol monooxygenase YgiN